MPLKVDDRSSQPATVKQFPTGDEGELIVYNHQQVVTISHATEATISQKLPQIFGEDTLEIDQASAKRLSCGRMKVGTQDSFDPKAATVKRTRRRQSSGSDDVSITGLSKPSEMDVDHCQGQPITFLNVGPSMVSSQLADAPISDIHASTPHLVEGEEQSCLVSHSTNVDDQTTNEVDVPHPSHSTMEEPEEAKQLIVHRGDPEVGANIMATKLGKRRVRQTGSDAGNVVTRNLEEGRGPRKSRKVNSDVTRAGQTKNGRPSKATKVALSETVTSKNGLESTVPPDILDEMADQSKEKHLNKHRIVKTKRKSIVKKGVQHPQPGKQKPKPRLVTSAISKHPDPVPTEQTTQVVPANYPPSPIANALVTVTDVQHLVPAPITQIVRQIELFTFSNYLKKSDILIADNRYSAAS